MSTWMDSPTSTSSPSGGSFQVNATTVAMGINTVVNYTGSGSSSPPSYEAGAAKFNPSMAIIIVVLLGTFFFMAFLSIYVKKCVTTEGDMEHHHIPMSWAVDHSTGMRRWHPQHQHGTPAALLLHQQQGLDKASIQALPLVCFTKSKDCVVCLSEFQQNECLRLLPRCGHTFHVDCIDMWLVSHTTCPICRFNLTLPVDTPSPPSLHHLPLQHAAQSIQGEPLPPPSTSPSTLPGGAESNRAPSPAPVHGNSEQHDIAISIPDSLEVNSNQVLASSHEQECVEEHQTQQQGNGATRDGAQSLLLKVWKVFKSWKTGFGARIFS